MDALTIFDIFDELAGVDLFDLALILLAVIAAVLAAPIAFVTSSKPKLSNSAGLALRPDAGGGAFLHPLVAAARNFNRRKPDAGLF